MAASRKNYYVILGITKNATPDEIKRAYYNKARILHPDKNHDMDTHSQMVELSEAYQVLIDPLKRFNYDRNYFTSSFANPRPSQPSNYSKSSAEKTPQNPLSTKLTRLHGILIDAHFYEYDLESSAEFKIILSKLSETNFNQTENFELFRFDTKTINASAAYLLTADQLGLKFLLQEPDVRKKFRAESLNATVKQPLRTSKINLSPLYFLAITKDGLKLLSMDAVLRSKITSEGLNTDLDHIHRYLFVGSPVSHNNFEIDSDRLHGGSDKFSVLYWLTSTELGRNILLKDASLRDKINGEALNRTLKRVITNKDSGLSPVYWLTSTVTGRRILYEDRRLRGLINQHSLNSVVTSDEHNKNTAAYCLLNSPDGRELLDMNNGLLRNKVFLKGKLIEQPITWKPTKFYKRNEVGYSEQSKLAKLKNYFRVG